MRLERGGEQLVPGGRRQDCPVGRQVNAKGLLTRQVFAGLAGFDDVQAVTGLTLRGFFYPLPPLYRLLSVPDQPLDGEILIQGGPMDAGG